MRPVQLFVMTFCFGLMPLSLAIAEQDPPELSVSKLPAGTDNYFGPVYVINDYRLEPTLTIRQLELEYFSSAGDQFDKATTRRKKNLSVPVGQQVVFPVEKGVCVYQARIKAIVTVNGATKVFLVGSYPQYGLSGCITSIYFRTSGMIDHL